MRSTTVFAAVMAASVSLGLPPPAHADEANARQLFKAMSDYMVGQKAISFSYDSDLAIVTSDLQKVDFVSSGTLTLSRPNKLRMTRTGGFVDVEMVYDGENLGILGKNLDVYSRVPSKGTIDNLIDTLRFDFGLEMPAADLISSSPFDIMMSNVTDVKDLGSGVIGGKECDHLAFRTEDTDWQIWIAQGDAPYPLRFMITSKMMAQAPSYTIDVKDWKTGQAVAADTFALNTGDAKEVKIGDLHGLDEVPDLSGKGGAQ
jgi:hypothetical protein